jgi:hypothetical protein
MKNHIIGNASDAECMTSNPKRGFDRCIKGKHFQAENLRELAALPHGTTRNQTTLSRVPGGGRVTMR